MRLKRKDLYKPAMTPLVSFTQPFYYTWVFICLRSNHFFKKYCLEVFYTFLLSI